MLSDSKTDPDSSNYQTDLSWCDVVTDLPWCQFVQYLLIDNSIKFTTLAQHVQEHSETENTKSIGRLMYNQNHETHLYLTK